MQHYQGKEMGEGVGGVGATLHHFRSVNAGPVLQQQPHRLHVPVSRGAIQCGALALHGSAGSGARRVAHAALTQHRLLATALCQDIDCNIYYWLQRCTPRTPRPLNPPMQILVPPHPIRENGIS
jgi:hypothetical protein